jgi:hypothetical protein
VILETFLWVLVIGGGMMLLLVLILWINSNN